jgi:hypothetical protein
MAVQPNGQVLVAGLPEFQVNGKTAHYVARLNVDGSVDSAFRPRLLGLPSVINVAAFRDGSVLLVLEDSRLSRLNPDGTIDTLFRDPNIGETIRHIAVDSTNRLLLQGVSNVSLIRMLTDGTFDNRYLSNANIGSVQSFALHA